MQLLGATQEGQLRAAVLAGLRLTGFVLLLDATRAALLAGHRALQSPRAGHFWSPVVTCTPGDGFYRVDSRHLRGFYSWRDILGGLGIVASAAVFVVALAVPFDDPAFLVALMLAVRGGRMID